MQSYKIYRSTTSGGFYTLLSMVPSATLSFTDNTPLAGMEYFYVVTAVDVNGLESAPSQEIAVTIPSP